MSDYEPKCKKTLPIIFDDRMPGSNLTPKLVSRVNGNTEDLKNLYEETETMQGDIESLQEDVDDKLDIPETAGTAGQVLTSDGEGGAVWASVGSGEIVVDPTLTVEGAAADAKKTGGEITHLKQDINELESDLTAEAGARESADEAINDELATKANIDGSYDELTSGSSKQLLSDKGITDKVPYLLRASGGNGADREEDKIVGGTVAWNQVCTNGNSITLNRDSARTTSLQAGVMAVVGHIYFYACKITAISGNPTLNVQYGGSPSLGSSVGYQCAIGKASANPLSYAYVFMGSEASSGSTLTFEKFMIVDLTQMFGTSIADRAYALEQATAGSGIAWLKSMGFFTADYYPYDAGTLKSVEGLTAHSMVGFNQWDEEWEVGNIDANTGNNSPSTAYIRAKNFIPVIPTTSYYFKTPAQSYIYRYSKDGAYLGYLGPYTNATFTMPSDVYFVRFVIGSTYGITYKNDVCINLSDPAKNGTYEPYVKHSYPLDSTLTLRGIPKLDSNNQVYYDGDEYASDGTVTRRYGVVDLGTLTWTYVASGSTVAPYFYASYSEIKNNGNPAYDAINAICSKYEIVPRNTTNFDDKKICGDGSATVITQIQIKDSAYTDAATLKTSLSGVYLVYELATPTTEEANPYQNPQILDPYGTEAYETTGIVPVGHETFYPENLRKKIEDTPSSPTTDGDYILRRTSGVNTYATAPGMDVVTVSGTTVTQTGVTNKFYVCGTLATLTFTAPSSGICGIRFTSGSTPTVLTVSGVSYWMNGFDPTSLEASKTYEISILNGLGVVGC